MKNEIVDGEKQFFETGVKTYLAADDAMTEFRRLVQHKCKTAASRRLDELNQACGMHWAVSDLNDYLEPNGNNHHIGEQVELKGLGGLYFCLRLSRIDESRPLAAFVFLYRARRDLAIDLWARASGCVLGKNHLNFAQPFPEDKIPDFEDYLDRAITDFLAFIKASGGLQKYLGQNVKLGAKVIR